MLDEIAKQPARNFLAGCLFSMRIEVRLAGWLNVGSAQTLGFFADLEGDLLAFLERAITIGLNCAVMNEDVFATIFLLDEAEALRVVEPLHGTVNHVTKSFIVGRGRLACETKGITAMLRLYAQIQQYFVISSCEPR